MADNWQIKKQKKFFFHCVWLVFIGYSKSYEERKKDLI